MPFLRTECLAFISLQRIRSQSRSQSSIMFILVGLSGRSHAATRRRYRHLVAFLRHGKLGHGIGAFERELFHKIILVQ